MGSVSARSWIWGSSKYATASRAFFLALQPLAVLLPSPPFVAAFRWIDFASWYSQGYFPEAADASRNRAWRVPLIASRTLFQGSILPCFWESEVAIVSAVVSSGFQAPGWFSGKASAAPMAGGGAELTGPALDHDRNPTSPTPGSTAAASATRRMASSAAGMTFGGHDPMNG